MVLRRIGIAFWAVGLLVVVGCNSPLIRSQSLETADFETTVEVTPERPRLVRDLAAPWGMNFLKIEGVALATRLNGTGSDPAPSPLRTVLIDEMQTHEVDKPQQQLKSSRNSLVVAKAYLPPGIQKGDRFDVEVRVPPRSKTTSLEGGWLMAVRMRELQVLENAVRSGRVSGLAEGSILVDSAFNGEANEQLAIRGRVLGGGQSQMTRMLGLVIRAQHSSAQTSSRVAAAINHRFHRFERGARSGVATAKRPNFVELAVHPRYRNNITRYMRVVMSISLAGNPNSRIEELMSLERRLLEPTTSARAALELEAIGDEAVDTLKRGLVSANPEVRFYSAEALAYLDVADAATVLAEAARDEPAFRWHSLTALAAMDHVAAYEALSSLLHVDSAETRYGAFRAMRIRNPNDPLVQGEVVDRKFRYHVIPSTGPAMVHFARSKQPEIILFGHEQAVVPPAFLFAGKEIVAKGLRDGRIKVTRFGVGEEDQVEICEANVNDLIRTFVRLGATYTELLAALQVARSEEYLESRLVIDALPRPGRRYYRDDNGTNHALPEMFVNSYDEDENKPENVPLAEPLDDLDEENEPSGGFFGKMKGWFQG